MEDLGLGSELAMPLSLSQFGRVANLREQMLWQAIELFKHSNGGRITSSADTVKSVLAIADGLVRYIEEGVNQ